MNIQRNHTDSSQNIRKPSAATRFYKCAWTTSLEEDLPNSHLEMFCEFSIPNCSGLGGSESC